MWQLKWSAVTSERRIIHDSGPSDNRQPAVWSVDYQKSTPTAESTREDQTGVFTVFCPSLTLQSLLLCFSSYSLDTIKQTHLVSGSVHSSNRSDTRSVHHRTHTALVLTSVHGSLFWVSESVTCSLVHNQFNPAVLKTTTTTKQSDRLLNNKTKNISGYFF